MLRNLIRYLPVTTLILLYLFICGSLYLISFWSFFDLDISNIVEIWEIPKSFLMPFVISNGVIVFFFLANMVTIDFQLKKKNKSQDTAVAKPKIIKKRHWIIDFLLSRDFWTSILISLVYLTFPTSSSNKLSLVWVIICVIFCFVTASYIMKLEVVKKILPYYSLRYYVIVLLVLTPVMSFTKGRTSAISIYTNKEIKYVIINPNKTSMDGSLINDSASFKLLGFLGDKLIISTINNKIIRILNQTSVNEVELREPEDKKQLKALPESVKKLQ